MGTDVRELFQQNGVPLRIEKLFEHLTYPKDTRVQEGRIT